MTMNPKNILKLLNFAFDHTMYDINSNINDSETSFALYLIDIIKDAINDDVFIETYDTLCFHDNSVIADKAEPVEDDEVNDEFNESFEEGTEVNDNIDIEYKKNAVNFWRSSKTSRRSLSTV